MMELKKLDISEVCLLLNMGRLVLLLLVLEGKFASQRQEATMVFLLFFATEGKFSSQKPKISHEIHLSYVDAFDLLILIRARKFSSRQQKVSVLFLLLLITERKFSSQKLKVYKVFLFYQCTCTGLTSATEVRKVFFVETRDLYGISAAGNFLSIFNSRYIDISLLFSTADRCITFLLVKSMSTNLMNECCPCYGTSVSWRSLGMQKKTYTSLKLKK